MLTDNNERKAGRLELKAEFLKENEYASTRELFTECFGDDEEFMQEFYGDSDACGLCTGVIGSGLIAAMRDEAGVCCAMVQVIIKTAILKDGTGIPVPYIMGVCTLPEFRHRGFMDRLMSLVMDRLRLEGYSWCFLIAVDRNIYRHLGFVYDRKLSRRECELLYADDGLDIASARLLQPEDAALKDPEEYFKYIYIV